MENFGQRLKTMRKAKKLSQEAFGESIGITGASVSRLESGENNPADATVKLIAKTYGVSEAWLRTGEGEMEEKDFFAELAARQSLGPATKFLVKTLENLFISLGEEACLKVVEELLPQMQALVNNASPGESVIPPESPASAERLDRLIAEQAAFKQDQRSG